MNTFLLFLKTKYALLIGFVVLTGTIHAQELALPVDGGMLKGTLLSAGNPSDTPLVILISGSGPTDRDGNQPQLKTNSIRLLAEALQEAGIPSFRYDKRGSGQSISSVPESDLTLETYVKDVSQWIGYLSREKKFNKIVVAGHSEGALIGLLVCRNNPAVKGYISIAGAGKPIDRILKDQLAAQSPALAAEADPVIRALKNGTRTESVPPALQSLFRPSVQPYLISWMKYDPAEEIGKLAIPVLIIQGETDIQVSAANAKALAAAAPKASLKLIPEMNHVLKTCKSLAPLAQQTTYINSTLPLHPTLTEEMVRFVRHLP